MTATDTSPEPSPSAAARSVPSGPERPLLGSVRAEWVKFRSVRSTWWGLATALVLMVATAAMAAVNTASGMDRGSIPEAAVPASEMAVYGAVWVVQFALIGVGLTFVTAEYASGSIRSSLQVVPARWRLLTAKAVVSGAVVFAAALVISAAGTLTAHLVLLHPLLGDHGTLDPAETVVNLLRCAVFLTLICLLSLGAGTALRSTAAALTTVFLLILGLPAMLMLSGSELLFELFVRLPFTAGVAFLDSGFVVGPLDGMLSSAGGLVVLMFWAAAALAVGALVLHRRDA